MYLRVLSGDLGKCLNKNRVIMEGVIKDVGTYIWRSSDGVSNENTLIKSINASASTENSYQNKDKSSFITYLVLF